MNRLASMTALFALLLVTGGAASTAGEIDGEDPFEFKSRMSAPQETADPPSNGSGKARVRFNRRLTSVHVEVAVRNLESNVADAHLHCALAGQDSPFVLPLSPLKGVTEGEIVDDRFTNGDLVVDCAATCGFPVNNIASLRFAAERGCVYVNVHTDSFAAGEVRGQLLPDD